MNDEKESGTEAISDEDRELVEQPRQSKSSDKVYSVDEAINHLRFGPFQILITVFCGLLWMADAMELMILSVLSPVVGCQWDLSKSEEALITSIVFLGFFIGSFFWGVIFDIIGRKKGLLLVNILILLFSVLSAIKVSPDDGKLPGYPWLIVCRFLVGFGASGTSQVITYYVEFLPVKARAVCLVLVDVWWSVGTMFGAALAIGVMPHLGWHWYLGLAAIPLVLVLFFFPVVPESARFYLVKGKSKEAEKVLAKVARYNCKKALSGRLVVQEDKQEMDVHRDVVMYSQGSVVIPDHATSYDVTSVDQDVDDTSYELNQTNSDGIEDTPLLDSDEIAPDASSSQDAPETEARSSKIHNILRSFSLLFVDGMWKTTVILFNLWLGAAWLYYGIILLTTSLLQHDPHCVSMLSTNSSANDSLTCRELDTNDYIKILWAAAAEIPGLLITVLLIELLGRKLTLSIEFIGSMVGFLLLFICSSKTLLTFFLFLTRAFTTGVFQGVYVYTPEVYPTKSRAFGLGVCSAAARIGAIVTPYVAQVLIHANDYATLSLYAGSCLFFAILSLMLPIETKGRALRDKGHSGKL